MKLLLLVLFTICAVNAASSDWWKTATFYQVYPRSFKDANNDGMGDIQGVISKLDYFVDIGVNAIWLNPIFKSPQVDQGYDISDYKDIWESFGTLDDVNQLIEEAHIKNIKIILDFVPNHTSDEHEWFQKSVAGDEEFKDYYVWADAKQDNDGNNVPPNNWISNFKGSAWTWNEERQQYYYHNFAEQQPDLNYRNAKVVNAMKDVLTFWLDKGVDGFRVDAVPYLFESEDLADEPESGLLDDSNAYDYLDHMYTKDLDETIDMVYQWRQLLEDYTADNSNDDAKVLMTEAYSSLDKIFLYYGPKNGSNLGAHFTFNFNLITDISKNSNARDIVYSINKWLWNIPEGYTSNWVLGNHDNHRVATRLGVGNVDGLNMLKAVLPGVDVTYNGEEIGQEDGEVTFKQGADPSACKNEDTFDQVSRDFERTPFQWDSSANAGFNNGTVDSWLPVSDKYKETNLEKEKSDKENTHYKVYISLVTLRQNTVLTEGDVEIEAIGNYVVLLKRKQNTKNIILIYNFSDYTMTLNAEDYLPEKNNIEVVSSGSTKTVGKSVETPSNVPLDAHEALIVSFTDGTD